MNKGNKT